MKQEAIKRMKLLNIDEKIINNYSKNNVIPCFSWPEKNKDLPDKIMEEIKKVERTYKIKAYAIIFTKTALGDMWAILYIENNKDEWEYSRKDAEDKYPLAYVYNETEPAFSEFGSIQVRSIDGTLIRIA